MSADTPPDEAHRTRIGTDLHTTLFVEAGAGAGKTTALVGRIVSLVRSGTPIGNIAAITFTEKAAAELRTRTRDLLDVDDDPQCRAALDQLDHAPIGTLHSFARRILFDFPIEAGLPPGFTVLDELESGLHFEEAWGELLDDLLDVADPPAGMIAGGRALVELCEFDGFGIDKGARRMANDFRANWDLVDDRVDLSDPGPLTLDVSGLHEIAARIGATTVPPDDQQCDVVADIVATVPGVSSTNLRTQLETIAQLANSYGGWGERSRLPGAKGKWKRAFGPDGEELLSSLRSEEVELGRCAAELLAQVKQHRRRVLGAIIGRFVLDGAADRARAGQLEFHDLLVLARRLVTERAPIRRLLHERYQRILLDEFQDTDPIQLEIAVRLTARPDDPAHGAWRELRPIAGRLFIVGDPKQSIYRFRRADIAQYLSAGEQVGADDVRLTANFRSTRAVIDFTNDVFARLIEFEPDTQPAFTALDACRPAELLDHGSVTLLGAERHEDLAAHQRGGEVGAADLLRQREAADVAAAVSTALTEGWPVVDTHTKALRPCRAGDICILLPARISLPALEAELRATGVAYRAENSSVVYATTEVRDLLLALRAADDPTDTLALVEALRSPMYGCSDVELWQWIDQGGNWNIWSPPPSPLDGHPVAEALGHVRSVAERVRTVAVADLLAAVADERRLFDLALSEPDARDVWRRLRYVIEQARTWADAGGHGVRRYLRWARLQASESRIADTILPEHDHDAVRVMTIHAAKGLEFPITMVAGLTTRPRRATTSGVVWANDTWMLAGRGDDGVFDAHQPIDEQMGDAERRRLLYVACTRAVDHLVVSLHRAIPTKSNADYGDWGPLSSAELLWAAGASESSSGARPATFDVHPIPPFEAISAPVEWADTDLWRRERDRAITAASRRTGIAATRLSEELAGTDARRPPDDISGAAGTDDPGRADPGLDKHPVNVELPPWQRGRYGTSIGRAVHGVLQFCDLDTGHDIDNLARAQCAAEGVIGLHVQVAALARSALAAPIVRAVVDGAEHWRELFVAAPVGDRVLEGYVDLLVRTPEGLVIVDYKTDQWSGPKQSAERIGRYRLQLAAYGAALTTAIDEPIVGGLLVRCAPRGGADQIEIHDWPGALGEVRAELS